jgi:hypothetical protein
MNDNYKCDNLAECTCGCGTWCRLKGQFDENINYIEFDCKDCKDFVCDETLVSQDPNPMEEKKITEAYDRANEFRNWSDSSPEPDDHLDDPF